jgi:hypothetical protein
MSNAFIFNLPQDFLTQDAIIEYRILLEKNYIQYENVLDYLNSSIKSVSYPGLNFEMPKQMQPFGKNINYKPAINVQDLSSRELTITFRSIDSDLNYWIMYDIFIKHYLDSINLWVKPFTITALDVNRDAIYNIIFKEIIAYNLSENIFDYSQQKIVNKEFTLNIKYNFIEMDFLLNPNKILDLKSDLPNIINLR